MIQNNIIYNILFINFQRLPVRLVLDAEPLDLPKVVEVCERLHIFYNDFMIISYFPKHSIVNLILYSL